MSDRIKPIKMFSLAACCLNLTCTMLSQAGEPAGVSLSGDWQVAVSVKGTSPLNATLEVTPPDIVTVTAEKYGKFPDFNPKAWGGWQKGAALTGLRAAECTVKGALDPASLIVREGPENTALTYEKGKDYDADLDWGGVGRLPNAVSSRVSPYSSVTSMLKCDLIR